MNRKTDGFTLIEVMVALAVIALALPSLMTAIFGYIEGTGYLRDKLQAQWVAENRIAELRLANQTGGNLPMSKQHGEEKLAGRTWYWQSRTKAFKQAEFAGIYGIEVSVWEEEPKDDESPLISLVGIVRKPAPQPITRAAPEHPPSSTGNSGGGGST